MANEIVKYENQLNSVSFRHFNARELNLFFSIVSRMRDKGTERVSFTFNELHELSRYSDHGERLVKDLEGVYTKMQNLNMWYDDGNIIEHWVLFPGFQINRKETTVTVSINPELKSVLNQLSNWTRFSLEQFASLKSTYSKTLFRLLKQYRTVGKRNFSMQEFRNLLDIPKSYSVSDIDKKVMTPFKKELAGIFYGLSIRKLRKGRGGKIVGYTFTWKSERKNANDFTNGQALSNSTRKRQNKRNEPMPDYSKPKREITDADRNKLAEQLELLQALGNHDKNK